MKIMIATGGTGGHINPALDLAHILKERNPKNEVIFVGSDNRMEATVIPDAGYKFYGLHITTTAGSIFSKMTYATSLMKAYFESKKILKKEKPDICIGFGNYISVPLILAAHHLGIKTMLHEQNSFAGKANKFLSRFADAVVGCYESNQEQMPKANVRILGNPSASVVKDTVFDPEVIKSVGLSTEIPYVVFMMGSLGSSSVSKVIDEAIPLFDQDFQVMIVSGKANAYQFENKESKNVKFVPYIDGKQALKGCLLAVTRAGATTISEICALPTAAVLIPSPFVANNHQVYNAKELVDNDAAIMIEEKELSPKLLASTVNMLVHDKDKCNKLKENAHKLAKVDAANEMIAWIEEVLHG